MRRREGSSTFLTAGNLVNDDARDVFYSPNGQDLVFAFSDDVIKH